MQKKLLEARVAVVYSGGLGSMVVRQLRDAGVGEIRALGPRPDNEHTAGSSSLAPRVVYHPLDCLNIWPDDSPAPLPDLFVVALESYDPGLLDTMDQLSYEREVPWCLLQAISAREACVGPLFVPRQSACYACMEGRLLCHLRYPDDYLAFRRHLQPGQDAGQESRMPASHVAPRHAFIAGMAVVEIIKFLTRYSAPQLVGRFVTADLSSWTSGVHDVQRLPQCRCTAAAQSPACRNA